jgi:hypothetical protein
LGRVVITRLALVDADADTAVRAESLATVDPWSLLAPTRARESSSRTRGSA